jgi:peptidyl-prolyl cis-trans isomerase B (cyclophilin B)
MLRVICVCFIIFACVVSSSAFAESSDPRVRLETNHGTIVLELNPEAAPHTVDNFLAYVREGFYDGTIFHRVIKGFMIQGGGLTPDMQKKATREPIENEADNGLENLQGTIAMARTNEPHSATSQFFINTVDNASLNFKAKNPQGWGYCVFGKVVEGMEVVDVIENLPTTTQSGRRDVPQEPVLIERAVVLEEE